MDEGPATPYHPRRSQRRADLGCPFAGVHFDLHRARTGSGPVIRREPARDERFDHEPAGQAYRRHDERNEDDEHPSAAALAPPSALLGSVPLKDRMRTFRRVQRRVPLVIGGDVVVMVVVVMVVLTEQ